MNAKERALELYKLHIALASTDGRLFRKTVMDTLMAETGCSLAASATHYNNAKKASAPVEGLGRAPAPAGLRRPGKGKTAEAIQDDNDCFTVIELLLAGNVETVGRCQSFHFQGEAGEVFESKIVTWPNSKWVIIQGLGPLHGETFELEPGEKIVRQYPVPPAPKEETKA